MKKVEMVVMSGFHFITSHFGLDIIWDNETFSTRILFGSHSHPTEEKVDHTGKNMEEYIVELEGII